METCFGEDAYCAKAAARPPHSIWVRVGANGAGNMKALLLSKYRELQIADLPTPAAGAGEVLIRVGACGICGSDVHGYDGSSGRRIPPIVMGHEAAGRIAAVGAGVTGLIEGDRVTFDSTIYCGACGYCRRGDAYPCQNTQ